MRTASLSFGAGATIDRILSTQRGANQASAVSANEARIRFAQVSGPGLGSPAHTGPAPATIRGSEGGRDT